MAAGFVGVGGAQETEQLRGRLGQIAARAEIEDARTGRRRPEGEDTPLRAEARRRVQSHRRGRRVVPRHTARRPAARPRRPRPAARSTPRSRPASPRRAAADAAASVQNGDHRRLQAYRAGPTVEGGGGEAAGLGDRGGEVGRAGAARPVGRRSDDRPAELLRAAFGRSGATANGPPRCPDLPGPARTPRLAL